MLETLVRQTHWANAKLIRDSASDYKRLFTLVKAKLAKERGFTL